LPFASCLPLFRVPPRAPQALPSGTIGPRAEALRPLHRHQIALLRRWRAERDHGTKNPGEEALVDEILLTVNAIAGGLRTTG